jgi:RNA polymerase sigma-70 factor, ECF subfamily
LKEKFVAEIDENKGIIFKVCNMYCRNREDKEDLFQDIVLQLWRSYSSFKGESKFSTWMYRIAINTAITRLRKETKKENFILTNIDELQIPTYNTSEQNDKMELIYQAISQLSEVEKAITMLYIDECTYKEMSEIIGISESNVGFKLNRIKAKLKKIIKTL